jgi:DNA polymerase elongation subunit (family B)
LKTGDINSTMDIILDFLNRLSNREIHIKDLVSTSTLKDRNEYSNPEIIGHLKLAELMIKMGIKQYRKGDRVEYIIVDENSSDSLECLDAR